MWKWRCKCRTGKARARMKRGGIERKVWFNNIIMKTGRLEWQNCLGKMWTRAHENITRVFQSLFRLSIDLQVGAGQGQSALSIELFDAQDERFFSFKNRVFHAKRAHLMAVFGAEHQNVERRSKTGQETELADRESGRNETKDKRVPCTHFKCWDFANSN